MWFCANTDYTLSFWIFDYVPDPRYDTWIDAEVNGPAGLGDAFGFTLNPTTQIQNGFTLWQATWTHRSESYYAQLDLYISTVTNITIDDISLVPGIAATVTSVSLQSSTSDLSKASTATPLLTSSTSTAALPSTTSTISACTTTTSSVLSNGGFTAPMSYMSVPSWTFSGPMTYSPYLESNENMGVYVVVPKYPVPC